MASLRDFDRQITLVREESMRITLYLGTDQGDPFGVASDDVVEFSLAETAEGPRLLHRSTDDATAQAVVVDGLPALDCDAITADEWAGIGSGFYIGQVKISNAGTGTVRYSRPFRVVVEASVGAT